MNASEGEADICQHCRKPFEIVFVKFRFSGVGMIASCPNCARISAEYVQSEISDRLKIGRGFWQGMAGRMDQLNVRVKYVLAFLFAAVITAAVLRHVTHVYGGFSREEIREDALLAIPAVLVAIVWLRRKRGQRGPFT